jgi:hypothetical protein
MLIFTGVKIINGIKKPPAIAEGITSFTLEAADFTNDVFRKVLMRSSLVGLITQYGTQLLPGTRYYPRFVTPPAFSR